MNNLIRILLLEDSAIDAELIEAHLARAGLTFEISRVVGRLDYVDALRSFEPHIILADYSLPSFDGLTALSIAREQNLELPFIFVSGAVGEEFAIGALKRGATDYVLKRNLVRLGTAVERALSEAQERAAFRKAAVALRASEINTRLAVEAAGLGTWEYQPRTHAFHCDARCKALLGLPADADATFDVFLSGCHAADAQRVRQSVAAAITAGSFGRVAEEFRTIDPHGLERWVAARGHAVFDNGVCVRLIGVVRDVTAEKRAEKMLRRENESLEARVVERTRERDRIWTISNDLMAVCRPDGVLTAVNPAWQRGLGWTERELVGARFVALIHADDADATQAKMAKLSRDVPTLPFDNRIRTKNGAYRWIRWNASPDKGFFYAIGRDVTEEKAATRDLAHANRQLQDQIAEREEVEKTLRQMQRLEAVGQLTSGVAHDFNNLLTVILGNVSFMQRDVDALPIEGKLKQRLANVRSAAERGAKLTGQLLAFSRRQRLEPKLVDLNETILSMRDLLQSTMGGGVRIETRLHAGLWSTLVDPTQTELIILNLAINARDAMAAGGMLTVETGNVTMADGHPEGPGPGDYVTLSVSDTGAGMTEEVLARAFEPFFTTKEVGKGSGLGLAQVYGFARQSGGGAHIETRLGHGSCVKVYLPRDRSELLPPKGPVETIVASPANGRRRHSILLVDDDDAVRDVTAGMLVNLGYRPVEAGSGRDALAILDGGANFDMLIADYAMPGMNGVELANEAKSRRPDLPVLFITGYADATALRGVGQDRVILKPFREEELSRKAAAVLGTHRLDGEASMMRRL